MYIMNDYAIISYAFKKGKLLESINQCKLDQNFQTHTDEADLYSYVRTDEIDKLSNEVKLEREQIIAVDGPTDYIRPTINAMNDDEFEIYKQYVLKVSTRHDMLGASSHVMDILKKPY